MKIRETEKHLNVIKKIITDKKNYLKDLNSYLNDTKRKSLSCHQRHLHLKSRINDMKNSIAKQSVSLNESSREKSSMEENIQHILREKLCSLTAYIYQLSEENVTALDDSSDRMEASFSSESTPLLCFSSDSSQSEKKLNKVMSFTRYKIVEPWIASNENFQLQCS